MRGQVFGQPRVSRGFDDRQVAAVYDVATVVARTLDLVTNMFAQFGRAAGEAPLGALSPP
jgi:hypothetical protein